MGERYNDGYNKGWNACLMAVRASLADLAEGRQCGIDTVIVAKVHLIAARASQPHPYETLGDRQTRREEQVCGLCGKGKDDPVHEVEGLNGTKFITEEEGK